MRMVAGCYPFAFAVNGLYMVCSRTPKTFGLKTNIN